MRKYLKAGFIVFLVGFICANFIPAQNTPDLDEYSVYSDLLKEEFIGKRTKQIVIKKETAVQNFSANEKIPTEGLQGSLSSLKKETAEDFLLRNKQSAKLTDKFKLKVKINLVGEEIDKIFIENNRNGSTENGWMIFHKRYPTADGIITLSRVGFNKEKTQALIFVAFGCGWLCGEGNYILLEKQEEEWKVKSKLINWVS